MIEEQEAVGVFDVEAVRAAICWPYADCSGVKPEPVEHGVVRHAAIRALNTPSGSFAARLGWMKK